MVDAENLIRFKGLSKPVKSRKVRLLHHYYAYLRIFHESTRGAFETTGRRPLLCGADINGHNMDCIEPFFRLDQSNDALEKRLSVIKEPKLAEDDLFLGTPGRWDGTLYPDLFGISETFMVLLSQVIRLGNELDIAKQYPEKSTLSLHEFSTRAKDLERCMAQWNAHSCSELSDAIPDHQSLEDSLVIAPAVRYLRSALHHALMIYFYRRIYDVNSSMLQDRVHKIRHCLASISDVEGDDIPYMSTSAWPGFIAACEALEAPLQESFTTLFAVCTERSGLETFSAASRIAKLVWEERQKSGGADFSWRDLLARDGGIRLFYS